MPAPRHDELPGPGETQLPPATSSVDGGGDSWRAEAGPPVQPAPPSVHTEHARYFVITSNTKENVVKSVRHGLWATQRKNEQRLDEAYRTAPAVILIFSVNRSDAFQGYACMRSPIGKPRSRSIDPFNGFGRLFDVEWLRLHDLPYHEVESLRNPLNCDRPVQFSRDGQELTNDVGRRLSGIIDRHIDNPGSFPQRPPPGRPGCGGCGAAPQMQPLSGAPPGFGAGEGPPAPYGAMPPPQAAAARPRGSSSGSGSEDGRRHRKRRRRDRKHRHPPHPLVADFDEQLEFFLDMDYEDYIEWFRRYGGGNPGPTPPPGVMPNSMPAPMGMVPPMHPQMAPPGMPPHGPVPVLPHHTSAAPPLHGAPLPPWQQLPPHMAGPPFGPPQVPPHLAPVHAPHLAPAHMPPPHMMAPMHMGRA